MNLRYSFGFLFLDQLRALWLITPKRSVRRLGSMKIYISSIQSNYLIMWWALHRFFSPTIIRPHINNNPYRLIPDVSPELLDIFLMCILLLLTAAPNKLHALLFWLLIYGLECLQPLLWHIVLIQLLVERLQSLETQDRVGQRVAIGFAWEQGLLLLWLLLIVN
jgi:hypothetical protein